MGTPGPISYREVMLYADEMEFGPNSRELMWEVIRRVDAKFLKLMNEKLSSQRPAPAAPQPKGHRRG